MVSFMLLLTPPDGFTFNDDDHAYQICLIKWQWGCFASSQGQSQNNETFFK